MANGKFAGGDGTVLNPYLIEDVADFLKAIELQGKHFKLITDIDLNIAPYNTGEGWTSRNIFNNVLDGDGFRIKNLFINTTKSNVGLFSGVYGCTIKNLGVTDVNIKGGIYTGGVAYAIANKSIINNCYVTGSVRGDMDVGGFAHGIHEGTMLNCYTHCDVVGNRGYIGGLVSTAYEKAIIKNCYSVGSVLNKASGRPGGLVGQNPLSSHANVINSFFDIQTTGQPTSAGGTGLTTLEMKTAQTFIKAGWDTDIWKIKDGEYPILFDEPMPISLYLYSANISRLEFPEIDKIEIRNATSSINYCLLKSSNSIKTLVGNQLIDTDLIEPLAKENFNEYGITDLSFISKDQWDILGDFEILNATDSESSPILGVAVPQYTLLDELTNPKLLIYSETPEPTVNIKAIPKPQLIEPTGDIFLKMLDKINSLTITSNQIGTGDIKIVFSVDGGVTWKTYNSSTLEFEDINISNLENIKSNGIDITTFNTIGEKWNEVISERKVRFAYYLEVDSLEDIAEVDKLDLNMDIQGRLKKAKHGVDYDYEYDNEHIYVSFLMDGSYKVNYTM